MPGYVIGLDLGRRCVKAAVLKGSFRGYEVEDFLSLEPEAPEDGSVPSDEAVFAAAKAILDTIDQPQATIVVGLPAGRVSTWLLEMPFADKKRLEATLPFEVENYVPWDLDSVILDYQVIDKGPPARVFAAMAPIHRVDELLEGLGEAGIDPRYVTVDAGALATLLETADLGLQPEATDTNEFGDEVAGPTPSPVILDVGATRTLLCVCPEGQPRWVRSLDRGADFLGKHDPMELTTSELDEVDAGGVAAEQARQSASARSRQAWISEVRASLLAAEESGFSVERIFLCGGGSRREGLEDLVYEATGIEVDPLPLPSGEVNPEDSPAPEAEHALAYALALRAFAKGNQPVDFRKGEFAWQADSRLYARLAIAGAAALFLLVAGGLVLHFMEVAKLKGQIDTQQQLLVSTVQSAFPEVPEASLGSDRQAIAVMQEKLGDVENRVEALRGFGMSPLDALKILSEVVPNNVTVDVDEYLVNDEMIRIRGQTDSFQSVDSIEAAIQGRPGWGEAKKSDVSKARDGKMRFVVTIPREPTEAEDEG
ncbi:MAG: pilus assembly protein PilM [Deltaproteobacteria bacterium]|nr:pilus assembly protein PilM [Deltaproteobacteria bacterium]